MPLTFQKKTLMGAFSMLGCKPNSPCTYYEEEVFVKVPI